MMVLVVDGSPNIDGPGSHVILVCNGSPSGLCLATERKPPLSFIRLHSHAFVAAGRCRSDA